VKPEKKSAAAGKTRRSWWKTQPGKIKKGCRSPNEASGGGGDGYLKSPPSREKCLQKPGKGKSVRGGTKNGNPPGGSLGGVGRSRKKTQGNARRKKIAVHGVKKPTDKR